MSKLNETDIQGFVLRGYNLPVARYLFLRFEDAERTRNLIRRLLHQITTGQHWDNGKPQSTVNIAFTHAGLIALDLPTATLITFPVEFQQGMKRRADILGDTGINSMKERLIRSCCRRFTLPSTKKISLNIQVFQGFMGVTAFIA